MEKKLKKLKKGRILLLYLFQQMSFLIIFKQINLT